MLTGVDNQWTAGCVDGRRKLHVQTDEFSFTAAGMDSFRRFVFSFNF